MLGQNALRLDLADHFKKHPVLHVSHTVPFNEGPTDIAEEVLVRPEPIPNVDGDPQIVQNILSHRIRGTGYQFSVIMKGAPHHDAAREPTRDFMDSDGTETDVWQISIEENRILREFH